MTWLLAALLVLQIVSLAVGWWYFTVLHNMVQGLYKKK